VSASPRPQRADAQRNRERVLDAAARAFAEGGADVTLDSIARAAGVGIGTLYRHFPTRDALVEAVYRNELARLCDSVPGLLAAMPAAAALRAWMDNFIDYIAAKRGMGDALRAVVAAGGNPFSHIRDLMVSAVATLIKAGIAEDTVRADVDPADVLSSLSGATLVASEPTQREMAGRLLDLLMDGLRYGTG
jgi:AcrR family transcriptional regulator